MLKLKINKNNINISKKLWNDKCLNKLATIFTKQENLNILEFTRELFYIRNIEILVKKLYLGNKLFINQSETFKEIRQCFDSWGELLFTNKFGNHRGTFAELLLFKTLNLHYSPDTILRERMFVLDNFKSYTPDFIIKLDDKFLIFESKASAYSIEIKTLYDLIDISNNIENASIFLFVFDYKNMVYDKIQDLMFQYDIPNEDMKIFNIICLEDIMNGNHLKNDFI